MFDFINFFLFFVNSWFPWISLWSDVWFLQFCFIYLLYLIFFTQNVFYTLFYLFLEVFLFGVFLSIFQMDLFTGFLWVTECTVIFVSMLLLFYLNTKGNWTRLNLSNYSFSFFYIAVFILFFSISFPGELENFSLLPVNIADLWEDYYEAIYNANSNDFTALLLSYYYFNSLEFIILGFLLLIGSVIVVCLYRLNNNIKLQKYDSLFEFFNFFNDFIDYVFMRKQNLFNQQRSASSTRIFKKKNK